MDTTAADSLREGQDLTYTQAFELCSSLLDGDMPDDHAAELLTLLARKGETPTEIHACVSTLLARAKTIPFDGPTVDTCGTGGSGRVRFNVSTSVAFILAAAGLTVAKHGNRGSRRPNGSFDLLEAIDIPIDLDGAAVAACLRETGLGFIFARTFHPAMANVAGPRKLAAGRTIFNLAGPLCNPTRVHTHVVGTPTIQDAQNIARTLLLLERERGFALCGNSGVDDVDLCGVAHLFAGDKTVSHTQHDPAELGLDSVPYNELPGGDANVNADLFLSLIDSRAPEPLRQVVCFSAALVFLAHGACVDTREGLVLADKLLRSGKVSQKVAQYRDAARQAISQAKS